MKPPIPIVKPCTAEWSAMVGDERKRLCAHCDKHVHNLSALTPGELQEFVQTSDGSECIGYVYRPDGTVKTATRWSRMRRWLSPLARPFAWVLGLILPWAFAGCASQRDTMVAGKRLPDPEKETPKCKVARPGADGQMTLGVPGRI